MSEDFHAAISNSEAYRLLDHEDGAGVTLYDPSLGGALSGIEQFIEEVVLSTEPAFVFGPQGGLQELPLARYREQMNRYLHHYSPIHGYGSYVELFFDAALNFPTALSPWEFNRFVEGIRTRYRSENFQRSLQTQYTDEKKLTRSLSAYVDALFVNYRRLLIVRIDLLYGKGHEPVTLDTAIGDFDRMMANSRHNKVFKDKVGFIRRLHFGRIRDHYHFHVLFFFDGHERKSGYYAAQQIGRYWGKITNGRGHFENCNANEAHYERKGMSAIGMVHRDDVERRANLHTVINYFVKSQQLLRRKAVGVTKAITRGVMPVPRATKAARPQGMLRLQQDQAFTGEKGRNQPAPSPDPYDLLLPT